ncbi:uncharacterized protein LOC131575107 isoform X5 [Poecile atricapillus]|uniref:uncharacterized protein LOC131575107 isoform X5 n=1 Tax=Poecile atricapillus TaxID=48891 RepID=UPI00273867C2|nr:uncharacterized protein LOC131575107 isoform X5 [Poecile atricapillus]
MWGGDNSRWGEVTIPGCPRRVPALAAVALLLATTVRAQEPPDVAVSGQSPGDLSTSAHLGKAVTSVAFPGSPVATEPRDPPRTPRNPPRTPGTPGTPPRGETPAPRAAPRAATPGGGSAEVPSPMAPPSPASLRRGCDAAAPDGSPEDSPVPPPVPPPLSPPRPGDPGGGRTPPRVPSPTMSPRSPQ